MSKETKEARKERQAQEEWRLVDLLARAGNKVEPEAAICADRKWRVDYLISRWKGNSLGGREILIALEIQGIGFGHHRFAAIVKGYERSNAIAANGWLLVQVTREDIKNGQALEYLSRCGVRVEPTAKEG